MQTPDYLQQHNESCRSLGQCVRIDNEVSEVSEVSFKKLRRCDAATFRLRTIQSKRSKLDKAATLQRNYRKMTMHRIKHFKLLSCRGTHNPTHFMRLGRGPNGPGGNLKVLGYGRWTFNHKITNYAMRPSRPSLSLSHMCMPLACRMRVCSLFVSTKARGWCITK